MGGQLWGRVCCLLGRCCLLGSCFLATTAKECHYVKVLRRSRGIAAAAPASPAGRASYAWILLGPTCGAPTVMFLAIDVMNPADAGPDGEAKWGVPRPRHWPSRTGIASEPHKRNHKIYIIVGRSTKPELAPRAVPPAHATKLRPEPDVVHTSMPEPTTSVLGAHLPSMGDTHCYPTPTSIPSTLPHPQRKNAPAEIMPHDTMTYSVFGASEIASRESAR